MYIQIPDVLLRFEWAFRKASSDLRGKATTKCSQETLEFLTEIRIIELATERYWFILYHSVGPEDDDL